MVRLVLPIISIQMTINLLFFAQLILREYKCSEAVTNFFIMKLLGIWVVVTGLVAFNCNQTNATAENKFVPLKFLDESKDKREIKFLIRQVLNWSESTKTIDLLPTLVDKKAKFYTGFDLVKHKQNLQNLKATNLFAVEFIDNYNQIILTLDKRLKKGEYGKWLAGDLPSFNFANGTNPWSGCQDVPYDKPNPFNFIEVETVKLENIKGVMNWKWGNLQHDTDPSWKKFKYKFRVVKENKIWKISYLEGFNFNTSVKKYDEL